MMDNRIPFNREELEDLLREWTNLLYKDNPPDNIFEDNSYILPDFLDGVFSIFEPSTFLNPGETSLGPVFKQEVTIEESKNKEPMGHRRIYENRKSY